ncbi:MAG: DinB family protein [Armatimonadota bacterium]|nr:DinB family protein [Armatimonadota bacterium]MDR7423552.1 DinB family protein [Armatimonadota bacterium]MDR7454516.1 DinB family protein [Armatimonadota bacterium]MDR7456737.1 DinB family protein [Armatimonadota bacterium]MDR7497451.1 DinB family protein [Armatimonadota bacterium]
MPTPEEITDLIGRYALGPRRLAEAVAGLSRDELLFSPGPGHWTIHENVVHVAETDLVAATRIRFALGEPGAAFVAFDEQRWAAAMDYLAVPLDDALAMLRTVREVTAVMLRRLPPEAWTRTGMHPQAGPQTIAYIVDYFTGHVDYHLNTIAKRRRQYAEHGGR